MEGAAKSNLSKLLGVTRTTANKSQRTSPLNSVASRLLLCKSISKHSSHANASASTTQTLSKPQSGAALLVNS